MIGGDFAVREFRRRGILELEAEEGADEGGGGGWVDVEGCSDGGVILRIEVEGVQLLVNEGQLRISVGSERRGEDSIRMHFGLDRR